MPHVEQKFLIIPLYLIHLHFRAQCDTLPENVTHNT
jgi:hypothetical protein